MSSNTPDRLLRTALRVNGAFSGLCGGTALLAGESLASTLGIRDALILPVQGGGLVLFSALLFYIASRPAIRPGVGLAIVAMDLAWVATTAVPLLLSGWLTELGTGVMLALSAIVTSFAALQYLGVRQIRLARASA